MIKNRSTVNGGIDRAGVGSVLIAFGGCQNFGSDVEGGWCGSVERLLSADFETGRWSSNSPPRPSVPTDGSAGWLSRSVPPILEPLPPDCACTIHSSSPCPMKGGRDVWPLDRVPNGRPKTGSD